jgi:hypothetical protein
MSRSLASRAGAAQTRTPVAITLIAIDKETRTAFGLGAASYRELVEAALETALANRFLNEVQLAERWGVSVKLLQKWRWKGGGPAFTTLGTSVRYGMLDILTHEQERRHASTSGRAMAETPIDSGVPHEGGRHG